MARRPPDDGGIVDTSAALASLYQAPFGEFVSSRTALVSQLKRSGHKEVAARLAGATKPTRAAWLVNQVYWRDRKVYDRVLDAGTAARAAQQARLLGQGDADLAETITRRDAAVRAAVARAEALANEDGAPASEATVAQVRGSFEAIAAHGTDGRLAHGHLTTDVEQPGLAALAGLVLPETPAPPVRRFEVVARGTRTEIPAAEEAQPPDPRVVAAEARVADLTEREEAARERAAELELGLTAAQERLTAAEATAAEAARELAAAKAAVEGGTRARDAVTRDLDQVTRERVKAAAALEKLQTPHLGAKGPSPRPRPTPADEPPPEPSTPRGRAKR
jgi:hypothetical protein